jgi:hypothetical protein
MLLGEEEIMASRLKFRHKKDTYQTLYHAALKRLHIPYVDLSMIGAGVPDLIVSHNKDTILFEIKTGSKTLLTEAEAVFHAYWQGRVYVVRSVEEMLHHLGLLK